MSVNVFDLKRKTHAGELLIEAFSIKAIVTSDSGLTASGRIKIKDFPKPGCLKDEETSFPWWARTQNTGNRRLRWSVQQTKRENCFGSGIIDHQIRIFVIKQLAKFISEYSGA